MKHSSFQHVANCKHIITMKTYKISSPKILSLKTKALKNKHQSTLKQAMENDCSKKLYKTKIEIKNGFLHKFQKGICLRGKSKVPMWELTSQLANLEVEKTILRNQRVTVTTFLSSFPKKQTYLSSKMLGFFSGNVVSTNKLGIIPNRWDPTKTQAFSKFSNCKFHLDHLR